MYVYVFNFRLEIMVNEELRTSAVYPFLIL